MKIVGSSTAGEEVGARVVGAGFDVILSKRDGLEKLAATVRVLLSASAGEEPSGPQSKV